MSTIKYSRQREAIKNYLAGRTDHPTAERIHSGLKEDFPNISLGTVYRNLTLLEELGEIIRIHAGGDADHYDGNVTPHPHFVCTSCQRVFDVQGVSLDEVTDVFALKVPGSVQGCQVLFHGVCADCGH